MTPAEVAATLRQFNGWRRDFDDKFEQPDSREIGEAIDVAVEMIESAEEDRALCDKLAGILTRTANVLKGEPKPLHRHSWHDLPDVARKLAVAAGQNTVNAMLAQERKAAIQKTTGEAREGDIEMIDTKALRQLAQSATPGPWVSKGRYIGTPCHMSYIGEVRDQCGNWSDTEKSRADAAFIAAANPAVITELLDRLEAAESSVAWHQRRWMALQMHQKKMREPERTIVCDILANGELMHPTVAGNRYAVKDTQGESK